ncbi:MAG TPA: type I methionyl aminopeptidase [Actinophytocola sp.]|uniref:type I methionyl aminopeptidase n=1 Tax=Actinophytocola sp. TaxID=1872138 RepID=UPI002DDD976E|nr:type I methionyl aminopeptidase [Actinophytocola sp.]HEV2781464.1 type I methionyl aminopeptidase [Actinophytocola sp.]
MVELKTADELAVMREAGRIVAAALAAVRAEARAGVTLLELDAVAADVIRGAGATSSFLNYHPSFAPTPFPGVICASVNEVIVHGIPDGYRLRDGDLVSIDCGACLDGFHGDSAITFTIGPPSSADATLMKNTEAALEAGVAAARPGGRLGDVSAAVGEVGRGAGYGIPQGFGGHGVGRRMHEDPSVPNEGRSGRGLPLRPGLVIAIEPMFMAGGRDRFVTKPDGWALCTADGSRAAHFEHTVAVTENGPVVLTAP